MIEKFDKFFHSFLRAYLIQPLYTQKKASYTMLFLLLITLYSIIVTMLATLAYGFNVVELLELSVWLVIVILISYLVKLGYLTLAINTFIISGLIKSMDILDSPLGLHLFIHLALIALILAAIHNRKYQLYIGLAITYLVMASRVVNSVQNNIYPKFDGLINYSISILLGFLMYLISVRYLGNIIDMEIEKADRLNYLTMTDPLTKLDNRYAFNQFIDHLDGSKTYSLFVLDIDYFKAVNDNYGHTIGDQVLKNFSQLLKDSLRLTDHIYRLGGEEFCVIVESVTKGNSLKIANSLRTAVENYDFGLKNNITVSIGFSYLKAAWKVEDFDKYYSASDHALYEAKEQGRNRVVEGLSPQ